MLKKTGYFCALLLFLTFIIPETRRFYLDHGIRWFVVLFSALSGSYVLVPLFKLLAIKLNVMDIPDYRKTHKAATPLLGGLSIITAFYLSIFLNYLFTEQLMGFIIATMLIAAISLIDDIKNISATVKIFVQLAAVAILLCHGIVIKIFPLEYFRNDFFIYWIGYGVNVIVTVLWILGITNAINFFDGMDGLATILSIIFAFFLAIVAVQNKQPFVGWLCLALIGGALGFLPYNFKIFKNAEIFLGDTGSTFLGFILATLAIMENWSGENPVVALISPLIIFSVCIYDMTFITINRIINGNVKSFKEWLSFVGRDHLHHRLQRIFGSKIKAVLIIGFISLSLGISATLLRSVKSYEIVLILLQVFSIISMIALFEVYYIKHFSASDRVDQSERK